MANRIVISSAAVAIALGLASCSQAETAEQCVERFVKQFPNEQWFDSGSWRSTLTYRLPDDFGISELQPGAVSDGREEGPRFTIASGSEQAAFDNFSRQPVPRKGAYLFLDDVAYFRTRGSVGTPKDTAAAGCVEGPEGSQLIRIEWAPEPKETNT